jgi:hypothetical protein
MAALQKADEKVNPKQRKALVRRLWSSNSGLDVVHRNAAGMMLAMKSIMWRLRLPGMRCRYSASAALPRSWFGWPWARTNFRRNFVRGLSKRIRELSAMTV